MRGRIAELAERLAGAEERLPRPAVTRETTEEVQRAAEIPPAPSAAGQAEEMAPAGYGRSLAIGVAAVPQRRAGLAVSVLPQDYRDLPKAAESAGPGLFTLPARAGNGTGEEAAKPG